MEPYELDATQAAQLIAARQLSCEELARSTLAHVARREPQVKAWAHIDPAQVVRNARELDTGQGGSALHGSTWGVKDVIDTRDMPTSQNSAIYLGHRPSKDAACVAVARHSGALILGKTETAEFAAGGRLPATRNPHNVLHTPGASSSGSAAAVGSCMAQLALATQTGGSLIRPAAYNGICGFKPTHGLVSTEGAKMFAPTLDTIGWYARSVADLSLAARVFGLAADAPRRPDGVRGLRVGLCRGPNRAHIEPDGESALLTAARRLADAGAIVEELDLPEPFERMTEAHRTIMRGEGRATFLCEYLAHRPQLHRSFIDLAENADGIGHGDLLRALDHAAACRVAFDALFGPRLHLLLTPPAPGEAPLASESEGSMIFNAMWTALHVPCISIPAGTGRRGLPLGVQLVAPRGRDSELLGMAQACAEVFGD
ncbi:Glutamyl-tRNA(Gln) amidotransferase subunit A [Pigmentiphaga humi]|uniref:Glutamyl-tRNA(Gln) amidotransferase subunit A n=1 Tax=Pigmentiphaga humi TaxID=2478468 RepID=A0A3P4AYR0_9BURK|nr:amidase [Pigmentiphaga humi]VCU68506.1 Glutamyl-tRNA(Gln) amidotransferase subunit A [Pigmentiphaga humi]